MSFRTEEQIITSFKARYGIHHTGMSNRDWFAELFGLKTALYSEEIWLEFPPSSNQYTNGTIDSDIRRTRTWNGASWNTVVGANNVPVEKLIFPLALLTGTNNQSWIGLDPPISSIDPPNVVPAQRLIDFIKYTDYGKDFIPRLFWDNGSGTAPGLEISTVSLPEQWIFDSPAGILLFGSDINDVFIPTGNTPVWIQAYRYIGSKGVSSGGGANTDILTVTSNYSISTGADFLTVLVDASSNNVTVTLPSATSNDARVLRVKKVDSTSNKVTVDTTGGDLLDGKATWYTTNQNEGVTVQADGAVGLEAWWIVPEKTPEHQVNLTDNNTQYIPLVPTSNAREVNVDYTVSLPIGAVHERGRITLIHDGTTAQLTNHEYSYTGSGINGLSFGTDINTGILRLSVTTAAVGEHPRMRYRFVRFDITV